MLVWSGSGGGGGARLAELAHALGFEDKPGCGAFHLPATPNGRGVAEAWAAASDGEEAEPEPIGLLIVSGDEAAADPSVRALAEHAEQVLAITMFQGLAVGWADLVLPATSYLERDGTTMNLEGRLQRQRRAVIPPVPGRARLDRAARIPVRRRRLAAPGGRVRRALRALYGGVGRRPWASRHRCRARAVQAPGSGDHGGRAAAPEADGPSSARCSSSATARSSPARRGARPGAPVPAPGAGARAREGGRRAAPDLDRRRRPRPFQRHLDELRAQSTAGWCRASRASRRSTRRTSTDRSRW